MKIYLAIPMLLLLGLSHSGIAQNDFPVEIEYEVNKIYPPLSIGKAELQEVQTLLDLNKHYKASWVREYLSVEVVTIQDGKVRRAVGKNELLNSAQKDLMSNADVHESIVVNVQYIPENTLKHNDPKDISFAVSINPEKEATFPGGQAALLSYLKFHAIDKIPEGTFKGYAFTAVQFTVDEEGRIIDAQIFWPSEDEKVDKLLLETICNMPNWKPAEYANGRKVKQDLALTVGNMENCAVNMINIGKGPRSN